jgi:hypothetical protein
MLFNLIPTGQRQLQRQLDADRVSWSRKLQLETEGAFSPEEIETFRMHGLYDEIPGNAAPALRISPPQRA